MIACYHSHNLLKCDGVIPLVELRQPGSPSSGTVETVEDDVEVDDNKEGILRCKQCEAGIAKDIDRVTRGGKHQHTFFNPAGIVYEIGCFQKATGCQVEGEMSREFSWFADYSWQIGFCRSCTNHLGWFFSSGDDTFYGLILNRLKEF